MFRWSKRKIEKASILASAGFPSSVAAIILGTTKATVLGRSRRKEEFKFSGKCRGKPPTEAEVGEMLSQARMLVGPDPEPEIIVPKPAEPKEEPVFVVKKNQPHLARKNKVVDKPLTREEKDLIFSIDGVDDESVMFVDMTKAHCKWVVGEIGGYETMICGRDRIEGSPYCERHSKRARSRGPGRPPKQENINPVEATSQTDTSRQRKSLPVTESCSS